MKKSIVSLFGWIVVPLLLTVLVAGVLYQYLDRPSDAARIAALEAMRSNGIDPISQEHYAVIDFDKPSFFRRLVIYGRDGGKRKYLVSHGVNSGGVSASDFSNETGSRQTSLGLYRLGETYEGKHGISRRLHGLDEEINHLAFERAIVLHSADYVSFPSILENIFAGEGPRLGRSFGCPAVSTDDYDEILSKLPEGSYLYHFYSGGEN